MMEVVEGNQAATSWLVDNPGKWCRMSDSVLVSAAVSLGTQWWPQQGWLW